jgi:hypothetical protein
MMETSVHYLLYDDLNLMIKALQNKKNNQIVSEPKQNLKFARTKT